MSHEHHLAHPGPRRAQALALPQLALPARPAVCRESRAGAGPVCGLLGGPALAPRRLHPQRRREDQHPGPRPLPRQPATGPRRGKRPGQPIHVEHEYERGGALAYLAAWDVRRGGIQGRCEATTGKAPFGRLVDQVMQQEPYRSAPRVFWIVDNGSSHRGAKAARELAARYPNLILVHLPTHASWLNQIEIYFSIIQRKVLTPNDFADLAAVEQRLLAYEDLYNRDGPALRLDSSRGRIWSAASPNSTGGRLPNPTATYETNH